MGAGKLQENRIVVIGFSFQTKRSALGFYERFGNSHIYACSNNGTAVSFLKSSMHIEKVLMKFGTGNISGIGYPEF